MNLLSSIFLCLIGVINALPFEFTYGGKVYKGFEGVIDGTLSVRVDRKDCPEFDETEYTVWFENISDKPSAVLENVIALKADFRGKNPVLRGCMGDHENFYSQYSRNLKVEKKVSFTSRSGRATHVEFPYFDLVYGDRGTRIALGWAGTWEAVFESDGRTTSLCATTNLDLKTVLLPGEKFRTGLVVMLNYQGRDENVSVNKWRSWFVKYNLPKADADGSPLEPFWTTCFASDTGLPNSDGSISENYYTWQRTLVKLQHEDMLPDFRWFDAGWYSDPAGNTVKSDWWGTTGSWELDPVKWPDGSLRASNDACHELGVKVLTWFEPERVTHIEDLCRNYGYKPEWGINTGRVITSNIGDPECLAWTMERIIKMMDENGVDMYREDNNSDPAGSWRVLDSRDEETLGLPRKGMNENKCIQGHYALWDGIIDYCRRSGKCTFLDSCASGGGRNDIESLRRGVPLLRSDYDRTTSAMRLSQSSGFNKWVPFSGSSTKETVGQLDEMDRTPDLYVTRASLLPVWNVTGRFSHNPDLDFDGYRRNLNLWKSCKGFLLKDFYQLSEYHGPEDTSGWTVFVYSDPDSGEAILLAFRQETCPDPDFTAKLPFAEGNYVVKDDDTGEERIIAGSELRSGLALHLPEPRSSLLLRFSLTK